MNSADVGKIQKAGSGGKKLNFKTGEMNNLLTLTNEQKALFAMLQGKEPEGAEIDWKALAGEAEKQAVFLMLQNVSCVPGEYREEWQGRLLRHTVANAHSFYAATEMNRIMRESGNRYVILKGIAAASYYPESSMRAFGDVDFLIDKAQQSRVEEALTAEGYKNWDTPHICHVVFQKDTQHLEMHFEIAGIPHGKQGERVRDYMKGALDETIEFSMNGNTFSTPLPKYHGLILLLHMQHHMLSEGIGLRHLIDWCYFVDKTAERDFWEKDLLPVLKEIGLFRFAAVMTKTGAMYLGTVCPEWCGVADEQLCDDVMDDILTGGNFGRKNRERSSSGMMISDHGKEGTRHGKLYNLWNVTVKAVRTNWPAVNKWPVLYAVYIPAIVLRRMFRVITGKRMSLLKSVKYADERKTVYDRLHVFEV